MLVREMKITQIKQALIDNKNECDLDVLAEKIYMASQIKYKYILDDLDVSALKKIWLEAVRNGNAVNVENVEELTVNERRRATQLRFHALIAKVKRNGKHLDNMWCITWKGAAFLAGKIAVSKWVETIDNEVVSHSAKMVSIKDFKILDDFRATYEIVNGKFEPIIERQPKLCLA